MSSILSRLLTLIVFCGLAMASHADCNNPLDYETRKLHSNESVNFCEAFQGKVLLVVNTASECGFTPQFKELQALYEKYQDRNFAIVGFPSDDFNQEHADEKETASVCYLNYGVTFPMVATSSVKGDTANPFFQALIAKAGQQPSWNFNKYLVSADFQSVQHFGPRTTPLNSELEQSVAAMLGE
ncbi:MAG: glutathione peroxidase [Cellvibrionaceae bacterium]